MKYIFHISTLLVLLNSFTAIAQIDSVPQATFDTLMKEIQYDKTKTILTPKKEKKKEKEDDIQFEQSPSGISFNFNGSLLQGFAYLLIAGLVVFILYYVFSGIKVKQHVDFKEIDLNQVEDIQEINVQEGYQLAIAEGNYRLALRMQFIKVLQILSEQEIISWKPDKTNRHYLRETRHHEWHQTFKSLIQSYEWVWYGNSEIGQSTFNELNPQFEYFNRIAE